jgi:VanZ family protein
MSHGSRVIGLLWLAGLIAVCIGSLGPAPQVMDDLGGDKFIHFLAYGTLGFLFTLGYLVHLKSILNSPKQLILVLSLIAFGHSLLGGLIELLQGFTGRQPDIWDGVANTLGCTFGVLVGWMGFYLMTYSKKSDDNFLKLRDLLNDNKKN